MIQLDGNTQCIKAIWHTPNELAVSLSRGLFDLLSCCIRVAESNVFSYRSTKENWVLRDNTYDSPPRGCCKITNVYVDVVNNGLENWSNLRTLAIKDNFPVAGIVIPEQQRMNR